MIASNKQQLSLIAICVGIAVLTIITYWPIRENDFVNFDDVQYVTDNPFIKDGLTVDSLVFAFTTNRVGNWHPLTWISHAIDIELFELNSKYHHLVNLTLHVLSCVILFLVLWRMTSRIWPSAVVAVLFAIHPMHVESVAWVAERKDLLCGFFWMLTLAAYAGYSKRPSVSRYLLVIFCYILGLLSKPMIVTLPFVLLLLDYWPLERLKPRVILEKVPLFVLSFIFSCITYAVQHGSGTTGRIKSLSFGSQIANAFYSYICYIGKLFIPINLAVLYPHPENTLVIWKPVIAVAVLILATAVFWFLLRPKKYIIVGWLWFLGTLVPVIGFVQVGYQGIADRYTYLPSIGLFILIIWAVDDFLSKLKIRNLHVALLTVLPVILFANMTFSQVKLWRNSITLYENALANTQNNYIMHHNLGCTYRDKGKIEKAKQQYKLTLKIMPDYIPARENLANVLYTEGKIEKAKHQYKLILRIMPDYISALNNLANILCTEGKFHESIEYYNKALSLSPNHLGARHNLGAALNSIGKTKEAIELYYQSLKINPNDPPILSNLAIFLLAKSEYRNPAKAVEYAERACKLTNYSEPQKVFTLAITYLNNEKTKQAYDVAIMARKLAISKGNMQIVKAIDNWLNKNKKLSK